MPVKFTSLCLLVVTLLSTAVVRAEIMRDLYAAQVPVADQSANALSAGASTALAQVLVKASGSDDLLQHPAVVQALAGARARVQQYSYSRAAAADESLMARYEFAPSYITGLVVEAGAPLWTANRPEVLAWIVVETAEGRGFVNWESMPEYAQALSAAFSRRGVPLQLPLFDLADTAALSPDTAWRLDGAALKDASARYGLAHILGARVALLNGSRVTGDFSYFSPAGRLDRATATDDFASFAAAGVALVADDMAARFAVQVSESSGIGMVVSGIRAYRDYAGVVNWLEKLELVDSAIVERIDGEVITLNVSARTDLAQLKALLNLNADLQPLPHSGFDGRLHYQWQP